MKHMLSSVLLVLMAATGCDQQVRDRPYEELSDNDLVARVGKITYTKGELECDIRIMKKLSLLSGNLPCETEDRRNTAKFRQSIINGFVNRALLLQEAKRRGIDLSADDMRVYQDAFIRNIFTQQALNYRGLLDALEPAAGQFHKNLKNDALSARIEQILMQELAASLPPPSAADIEKSRTETLDFNARLDDANRSLMRLATNSWKSIRAGNDFATVGRKLVKMRTEITFDEEYADPTGRLAQAPTDLTLPPTAAEDGIEIVKITQTPENARTIGRIVFKPRKQRPFPSLQEAASALRKNAIDDAVSKWFRTQRTKADILTIRLTN